MQEKNDAFETLNLRMEVNISLFVFALLKNCQASDAFRFYAKCLEKTIIFCQTIWEIFYLTFQQNVGRMKTEHKLGYSFSDTLVI